MTIASRSGAARTMADVAAHAGVHQATVSRTLTRPDVVSPATRRRVLDAVDELGYVPNVGARQLAGGRTGAVAVLVPDLANSFFSRLLKGMQQALRPFERRMMVADTEADADTEVDLVRGLTPNVDGIVLCSPVAPTTKLRRASDGTPLVFVNRSARHVPSVVIDQRAIVELGAEHLREFGHRRIGLLLGPSGYWSCSQRRRAATDAGLTVFDPAPPTFAGGASAFAQVASSGVTAVLAFNDLMALGLMQAAAAHGVVIPDELSVVGSDDIAMAAMSTPPLTTVAAPLDRLAAVAVDRLDAAINGRSTAHLPHRLAVQLVERTSCGPAGRRP